jgi:hypothetical protein
MRAIFPLFFQSLKLRNLWRPDRYPSTIIGAAVQLSAKATVKLGLCLNRELLADRCNGVLEMSEESALNESGRNIA